MKKRCIESYSEAEQLALAENFNCTSPIFLRCVYGKCRALVKLFGDRTVAMKLASRVFHAATAHVLNVELDDTSVAILERLRDDFMRYSARDAAAAGRKPTSDPRGGVIDALDIAGEGEKQNEEEQEAARLKALPRAAPINNHVNGDDNQLSQYAVAMVQRLRRMMHRKMTKRLDKFGNGAIYMLSLKAIFNAYVRGNALHGVTVSANRRMGVGVGNSLTTVDGFLLGGPYLSWSGFVTFLRDFNISSRPPQNTRAGQNFPAHLWEGFIPSTHHPPLVDMEQATCVFIEAARTSKPGIMVPKYEKRYAEIRQSMTEEPWIGVGRWLGTEDWRIDDGLNFAQFCDCLAKIGAIAFGGSAFGEALPEFEDKVDHFFTASLKLPEDGFWQSRVQKKLAAFKALVESPRAGSPSAPSESPRKTSGKRADASPLFGHSGLRKSLPP